MLQRAGACISHQQCVGCRAFLLQLMNIVKNSNKISTLINLQNNTVVISRYGSNGNTYVHYIDPMYMHKSHVYL